VILESKSQALAFRLDTSITILLDYPLFYKLSNLGFSEFSEHPQVF